YALTAPVLAETFLDNQAYTLGLAGQPIPGNTTAYVGMAWCVGDMTVDSVNYTIACAPQGVGNILQTDSLKADISLEVAQARNNSGFVCEPREEETAHLIVIKHVINNEHGTKVAGDFVTEVEAGDGDYVASFGGVEAPGVTLEVPVGAYNVNEQLAPGYAKTLGPDCSGTLAAGETKTCEITNNDADFLCPFEPREGLSVVDLGTGFLLSNSTEAAASKGPFPFVLPAGSYDITLASYDDHYAKPTQVQPYEQWYLKLQDGSSTTLATTPAISDLPQDQDYMVETVATNFAAPAGISQVVAFHNAYPHPIANSIIPLCAAFERKSGCRQVEVRGMGYWKTHEENWILPQTLGDESVDTASEAQDVFDLNDSVMRNKLMKHLLALKFNIAYFGVGPLVPASETITVDELAALADALLQDGSATDAQLEAMKNRVEAVNEADYLEDCD
ncbi:MAG: hypothetical protein U1C53_00475, partial [Candidatus Veblenbacteria bacterium]|nr:hypothetical protein [Candidatus Veblenbacteria bacterium]